MTDSKDDGDRGGVRRPGRRRAPDTKAESRISDYRAFLLNGSQEYLDLTNSDRAEFLDAGRRAAEHADRPGARTLLNAVVGRRGQARGVLDPVIERRQALKVLTKVSELNPSSTRTEARSPRPIAASARRIEKPPTGSAGAVPIVASGRS